jgi:hypothetical protein
MTTRDTAIWLTTACGIVDDVVRISTVMTPRIVGPKGTIAKLGASPTFQDWPAVAKGVKFSLEVQVGSWSAATPSSFTPAGPVVQVAAIAPSPSIEGPGASHVWRKIFSDETRVEAYEDSPTTPKRRVPIYFDHSVVRQMIDEAQAFCLLNALQLPAADLAADAPRKMALDALSESVDLVFGQQDLGSPSKRRYLQSSEVLSDVGAFRGFNAVINELRKAPSERERYLRPDLRQIFSGSEVENIAAAEKHLIMYQLYHDVGVRNRNKKIRAARSQLHPDPDVITLSALTLTIVKGDDGKMFELAEPIRVDLPTLAASDHAYEVWVGYLPDPRPDAPIVTDATKHQFAQPGSRASIYQGAAKVAEIGEFQIARVFWTGDEWKFLTIETTEFHAVVSALGSNPGLLRKLGVIFDFALPRATVFPGAPAQFEGRIRVVPAMGAGVDCPVGSPWTAFSVGQISSPRDAHHPKIESFQPRLGYSDGDPLEGGFRQMSDIVHSFYDISAGGMKLLQDLRTRRQEFARTEPRFPPEPGTPRAAGDKTREPDAPDYDKRLRPSALHTIGIGAVAPNEAIRLDRALERNAKAEQNLAQSIQNSGLNTALSSSSDQTLFFEDLLVGYVVDARLDGLWYSLCARQEKFWFGPHPGATPDLVLPPDEGCIGLGLDKVVDENGVVHLKLSERLFKWDGYSLVIPRPGESVPEVNAPRSVGGRLSVPVSSEIPLTIKDIVRPDSLPKLRYSEEICFRARTKDIAGRSWSVPEANQLERSNPDAGKRLRTDEIVFRRLDPIAAPVIMPLQNPGPSDLGTATEIALQPKPGADAQPQRSPDDTKVLVVRTGAGERWRSGRWLFCPPEINLLQAEWAGLFDIYKRPGQAYRIFKDRYARKLADGLFDRLLIVLRWFGSSALSTPYIPDVHAGGAALYYLPGHERPLGQGAVTHESLQNVLTKVDFAVDLKGPVIGKPYAQPFTLKLIASPAGGNRVSRYHRRTRTLEVYLPEGEQQLIRFGSYPDPRRLKDFQLFHVASTVTGADFILEKNIPGTKNISEAKPLFESGAISPVTPLSEIRLVHAIAAPLTTPAFSPSLTVSERRTFGRAVLIEDEIRLHRASTSKLEIEAVWDDYGDAREALSWPVVARMRSQPPITVTVPLPDLTIKPDETHTRLSIKVRHDFPDTRYRKVKYQITATSRYRDYFDKSLTSDPKKITRTSVLSKTFDILNTAPPDVPAVEYILPTFAWKTEGKLTSQPRKTSRLTGLRIFLRRPWPTSGEGEQLGILLRPTGAAPTDTTELPPSFSEIGSDPIRIDAGTPERYLSFDDFIIADPKGKRAGVVAIDVMPKLIPDVAPTPNANGDIPVEEDRQVTPDEAGFTTTTFDVAAFDVQYDSAKRLAYADIELQPRKEYFPFVRLVVARYQPQSARYAFLSRPVSADFVQIAPDRLLTINREERAGNVVGSLKDVLIFKLTGPMHGDVKRGSLLNEVEIIAVNDRLGSATFHDIEQFSLPVQLTHLSGPGGDTFAWVAEIDLKLARKLKEIQVAEYEVYRDPLDGSRERPRRRRAVYFYSLKREHLNG